MNQLTSNFFINLWFVLSLGSRATVKLWKLWVFSNFSRMTRNRSIWFGVALHPRLRIMSSCAVDLPGSTSVQNGSSFQGASKPCEEACSRKTRSSPQPGFGGIKRYEGKKYVYLRASQSLWIYYIKQSSPGLEKILTFEHRRNAERVAGELEWEVYEWVDTKRRTKPQTRISGGSFELIWTSISSTSGTDIIIFNDTTLPTAWTPASVRAALARPTWYNGWSVKCKNMRAWTRTFTGSSALSFDTAPAAISALNNTPSIVRGSGRPSGTFWL